MSDSSRPDLRAITVLGLLSAALLVLLWTSGGDGAAAPSPAGARADEPGVTEPLPENGAAVAVGGSDARRETGVAPRSGLELLGRIVDADGRPVGDVAVALDGPGDADREVRSDAGGRFVVGGLVTGTYQVIASGPHLLMHNQFVDVPESSTPQELTLVVDRGLPLSGQVVGPDRRPLAGAKVTPWRRGPTGEELDPRSAVQTDAGGQFQVWGAPRGTTFVFVECEGFAPTKGRMEASRAAVVQLERAN